MQTLQSFPPVVNDTTHTLILGSMPGKVSLVEAQYYAHPRNGFWHIMDALYGAGFDLAYPQRLACLLDNGIGLWDVIGTCTRTTSLDSDIVETSIIVNDFQQLLNLHPAICRIFFNGGKAEQTFNRYVRPVMVQQLTAVHCARLSSTSPANARYSLTDKVADWRQHLLQTSR